MDKTHYLFQMGVTFKCKEKFMVMDEETKVHSPHLTSYHSLTWTMGGTFDPAPLTSHGVHPPPMGGWVIRISSHYP